MKQPTAYNLQPTTSQRGSIIIFEVVLIFIFSLVMLAVLGNAAYQLKVIRSTSAREEAFHIAESGVNYYQWHLAHFASDYKDGTNNNGPYVHDYVDKDTQTIIGRYSLVITPPTVGSTVVTIQSTGWTLSNPSVKRTITTKYGIPSLAKYAFLTNSDMWIGSTESVSGTLQSNGGIRFDGTGNAPIISAKSTYTCTSTFGCSPSATKPGIWGAANQATQNFWKFPQPVVDFSSMTSDLATMKSNAQSAGIYLPPSSAQGYSLQFNSDGTVSVYKVTALRAPATTPGTDVNNNAHNESIDYSVRNLQFTQNIPANGLIYIEDKTWVEGTVAGRVTVAAAKLPYNASTSPSIYIANNITYVAKNGTNSLGLIAQKDIVLSYYTPNNLEIDAALIAQNGSAQVFYYPGNTKGTITVYGSVASYGSWTWSWVNGGGTLIGGYANTNTVYDGNLLYGAPPSFPLTTSGYQQISWSSD